VAGKVTATLTLPGTALVERYAEPTIADVDGFANGLAAHRVAAGPSPAGFPGYAGAGFSLSVFPTNVPQGVEPSFVLTPQGTQSNAGGPAAPAAEAAAQRFLAQFNLLPTYANRVDVSVSAQAPTVVHYVVQLQGRDLVGADGAPLGLAVAVEQDGTVLQASGPLPLTVQSAVYPLAPFADLARTAAASTSVTLDHAALVYVLAYDQPGVGYLEPAVLFTGAGKSVLVPAVAPAQLR
jgi:hypothetical protein